jgi:serine/threonine-protein kinase
MVALSPDGAQMAYVASPFRLYLRSMSDIDVKAIPGTEAFEGVREPAFSPDGREIAFFALADQTLKRMAVSGGAALTICQAETPTGISWGSDGIVFGQGRKGIMRISQKSLSGSAAGTPELIVRVKEGEVAHGPQLLPGGDQMLFTLATGTSPEYSDRWDKAHIVVQSLTSGVTKTLIEGGSDARYVTTGHIVYAVSGSLYAVAFDIARLEVIGSPVRIIEGVRRAAGTFTGAANFTFSGNGSLMYVPGPVSASSAQMDIALMDRSGDVRPLKLKAGPYLMPRVSPDGKRIALESDDGKEAVVWTYDLSGKTSIQRLTSGGNNRHPIWTSDGKRIVFQSDREGDAAIFWQSADGTGPAERLTKAEPGESHSPESWSPSGDILMFSVTKGSDVSLSTLSVHDQKVTPFDTVHSSNPPDSTFSPDGRWVAYTRAERGRMTVWVQPFPATGAKYELVAQGSDLPKHVRWSPDQKELFYNPRPSGFEAIGVTTQPTFSFGNPVALPKKLRFSPQGTRTPYDVTPDGKFVGVIPWGETRFDQGSDDQILVVLNWFEELKAHVHVR